MSIEDSIKRLREAQPVALLQKWQNLGVVGAQATPAANSLAVGIHKLYAIESEVLAHLLAALDEREALREDAERYRVLRRSLWDEGERAVSHTMMPRISDPRNSMLTYTRRGLDDALDAIRKEPT